MTRSRRTGPHRRAVIGGLGGLAGAGLMGRAFGAPGRRRPLLLSEANVVTLDPARPRADAVLLRDGRVEAVGARADLAAVAGPGVEEIGLGGRTVIPGLNDVHLHLTRGARTYGLELRWDGVPSLSRGLTMIREQAARTPDGHWVRVMGGWSPYQFEERRLPTPAELTGAAPDTPVFVLFLYSRGYLNAAGVRALSLTPRSVAERSSDRARFELTEDGGAIVHADPDATLINEVIGALPSPSAAQEASSAPHFYRELARFGLTSAIDLGGGGHAWPDDYIATRTLAQAGDLPLRITNYLPPQIPGEELEIVRRYTEEYALHRNMAEALRHGFEVGGVGEALTLSAYDFENFMADRPSLAERDGWRDELRPVVRHLLRARWPIRVHATYGETISRVLDVFEAAHAEERAEGRQGFEGLRWAIEHAETITPDGIARVAALGGGVTVQDRMAYAGELFADRYGEAAAADAPPIADLVGAGLPVGLGTDGTRVASYNPWVAYAWAVTGRTVGGAALMDERHRRGRLEALAMMTVGSAWFSGEERIKGRIAPGQLADLAVLDRDVTTVGDGDLAGTASLLTITGGRPTYAEGPFDGLAPPPLPPIEPGWSPVRAYGGWQG